MPLFLIPLIGLAAWFGGNAVGNAGQNAANTVTATTQPTNASQVPWYVPLLLWGIAAVVVILFIKKELLE